MRIEPIEIKIRTNFNALLKELAKRNDVERISNSYLARQMPMAYNQVKKFRNDEMTRLDLVTLQKAINFFHRHGYEVTPNDLLAWR